MNTLLHRKSPSIGGRSPGSERSVEVSEKHSLALLCFFTLAGLLSVVTAIFTTMLPMPGGLRYFWLVICVTTFGLLLIGITLFCLSYESKPTRPRH
jgi:purine-cytosine permease-like protein